MRVTDVKTFLVHPGMGKNWLLVKVETDEGIYGCGDAHQNSTLRHTTAFAARHGELRRQDHRLPLPYRGHKRFEVRGSRFSEGDSSNPAVYRAGFGTAGGR